MHWSPIAHCFLVYEKKISSDKELCDWSGWGKGNHRAQFPLPILLMGCTDRWQTDRTDSVTSTNAKVMTKQLSTKWQSAEVLLGKNTFLLCLPWLLVSSGKSSREHAGNMEKQHLSGSKSLLQYVLGYNSLQWKCHTTGADVMYTNSLGIIGKKISRPRTNCFI